MPVEVRAAPFDPWDELRCYRQQGLQPGARYGAIATFVGITRDFDDDGQVHALHLEHYPGMTERYLASLVEEARRRWDILDALVIHRVGALQPGDPIVLVAVWSSHRAAAFAACRYLMEEIKTRAPFWKKQIFSHGARWVEHNTAGE